jgi:hypothetical protein
LPGEGRHRGEPDGSGDVQEGEILNKINLFSSNITAVTKIDAAG